MTCEICKWWEWRLRDLRLSRDHAARRGERILEQDITRVRNILTEHKLAHLEATA
jgi:hypothetical protein